MQFGVKHRVKPELPDRGLTMWPLRTQEYRVHRDMKVGKHLWKSPNPSPRSEQDPQVPQNQVHLNAVYLHRQRMCDPSGQPTPGLPWTNYANIQLTGGKVTCRNPVIFSSDSSISFGRKWSTLLKIYIHLYAAILALVLVISFLEEIARSGLRLPPFFLFSLILSAGSERVILKPSLLSLLKKVCIL